MSGYQKIKVESYTQFGGINDKASQYLTGPHEFLDLVNLELDIIGDLKKRPGSTTYAGNSNTINGFFEYQRITGPSFMLAAINNQQWLVASLTMQVLNNSWGAGYTDYLSFVDHVFMCNGNHFMKWHGQTVLLQSNAVRPGSSVVFDNWLAGLPKPSFTITPTFTVGGTGAASGLSGTFTYTMAFLNDRGALGPPSNPFTLSFLGSTQIQIEIGLSGAFLLPASYGIGNSLFTNFMGAGLSSKTAALIFRDSGPGTARYRVTSLYMDNMYDAETSDDFSDNAFTQDLSFPEPQVVGISYAPQFLEIYQNRLFIGGFSLFPSTVQYSETGEPESFLPTSFFEVRTNDGDVLTGLKSFFQQILFFKDKSFHALSGDNDENFALKEISDQYGALNNRCITTFENNCLFLDRKGIVSYDGANIGLLSSEKIEGLFKTMNIDAAKQSAVMVHDRIRNQILTSIPINGATLNNTMIVYDYLAKAWTKREGPEIVSALAICRGNQTSPYVFYGSYSGAINFFTPSFISDVGVGFTCLLKSRFYAPEGQSTQKLFRKLWLNQEIVGASSQLEINFFQDYGSSVILSTVMYQNDFQNIINLGISAKALSVQVKQFSTTDKLHLHGMTVAYRYLRDD